MNISDVGSAVLFELEMVSSLNIVRISVLLNFSIRTRESTSGLLRHCESTDMQVPRLHGAERFRPWDQLLTEGLTETQGLCDIRRDNASVCYSY